ncbi:MAG TPA: DUF4388 domain-containing protein [Planctomycetota bacterium]|nr:DUF4388 domain-containing protein [Planctomycetota bacterium]
MKLKGDLDSIGLAELFKTLADQKANGILSVTSTMGEKHISIQQGALSVVSDRLAERTRLGDLLVARGHLTEAQLFETLKAQRETDPHARLGDLLVKKGVIGEEKLLESLRFQLEEEIYDLFSWKGATFEFDSDKGVDDVKRGSGEDDLHHLSIDAQALIAEASQKMGEWKDIQQRLPTPYLCFKISPKGEELLPRATRSTQMVVKLLKEGRTLETTVKRSCLGRFSVCKSVIKLLDDGWIFPYPTSELRMLASEHRAQKRFADALNIYRRLMEATEAEAERQQLQQLIDDTIDAILRAREAGDQIEGPEIVSHKKAAEDYMRRQRNRRIMMGAFCVVSAIVIAALLLQQFAPKADLPDNYLKAIKASDELVFEGKYEEAMEIWDKFYAGLDKESDLAQRVMERRKALPKKFDTHVETLLQPLEVAEKDGRLEEAEEGYTALIARYPRSPLVSRMKDGIARIAQTRETKKKEQLAAARQQKLDEAKRLKKDKLYTQARQTFQEILAEAPEGSDFKTQSDEQLKELAKIEERAKAALAAGEAELKEKRGEKAIEHFAAAFKEWHDLPEALKATEQHNRLKRRLAEVDVLLRQAKTAEDQREWLQALELIRKVETGYPEFEKVAELKQRSSLLAEQVTKIERDLQNARDLLKTDVAKARQAFADLVRHHAGFLAARNVSVPVTLSSRPPSTIKLDGREIGQTPQELSLPVGRPMVITFEKDGFDIYEKRIDSIRSHDMQIDARLQPKPLHVHQLNNGVYAPPRSIDDVMYIYNGSSLTAFNDKGERIWNIDRLFNENERSRPNSTGTGPVDDVGDLSWWFPRNLPEPYTPDTLLLALRSRDIIEISRNKPKGVKKLFSTPVEPVGQPFSEKKAGRDLIAVGCADGKVRGYDLAKPEGPIWEMPADPENSAPRGTIVAGLAPRPGSSCVSLSLSGKLTCFNLLDGKPLWSMDLKTAVADTNLLPTSASESVAAIVHVTGAVSLVDFDQRDRLWELPVTAGNDAVQATVDSSGVYVVTKGGVGALKKYPRTRSRQPPKYEWSRDLDSPSISNILVGPKAVYVSTEATVYAISTKDGSELWNYRPQQRPRFIALHKGLLYLITQDGKLTILKAD